MSLLIKNNLKGKIIWISIEGTDGVGKTTVALKLLHSLKKKHKKINFVFIKEFSDSPLGKLIKKIIKEKVFFKLDNIEHCPISETLILAGDLIYQIEKKLLHLKKKKSQKLCFISDRGPHSLLIYQQLRVSKYYQMFKEFDSWITSILYPLGWPDLTICLINNPKEIKIRLHQRGDKITRPGLAFINNVQKKYLNFSKKTDDGRYFVLHNKTGSLKETINNISELIKLY